MPCDCIAIVINANLPPSLPKIPENSTHTSLTMLCHTLYNEQEGPFEQCP